MVKFGKFAHTRDRTQWLKSAVEKIEGKRGRTTLRVPKSSLTSVLTEPVAA